VHLFSSSMFLSIITLKKKIGGEDAEFYFFFCLISQFIDIA
jgi:hypothetical protein